MTVISLQPKQKSTNFFGRKINKFLLKILLSYGKITELLAGEETFGAMLIKAASGELAIVSLDNEDWAVFL